MNKKRIVVLTGAGISQESGIKTFRDSGGLWENHRVEDVATPEAFERNPELVLNFYNERRRELKKVEPNAAHYALHELEKLFTVNIITQNVDNLHERAGSQKVLHLHGELTKVRSTHNQQELYEWQDDLRLDDKDSQGYPLRPHIVWFGEEVPNISQAIQIIKQAEIVIIIGTSMQVYPAAGLIDYAPIHSAIYLVDPSQTDLKSVIHISKNATLGVPELVAKLLESV